MARIDQPSMDPSRLDRLYADWTGDPLQNMKQAEHAAWRIEAMIVREGLGAGDRMGSERDLATRFGTGVGGIREALEILDLKGVCRSRRGPGGGVFVAEPSTAMTAQAIVSHVLGAGATDHDLAEAEGLLARFEALPACAADPLADLFGEFVRQMRACLPDISPPARAAPPRPLADAACFRWQFMADTRFSTAKQVGLAITLAIAEGRTEHDGRIGSEWELCDRYSASRATMRQALRLMETFGVVDSKPGRGNGVIAAPTNPIPMIRFIISYLLVRRLSAEQWVNAIQMFGESIIASVLSADDMDRQAFFRSGLERLAAADGALHIPLARGMMRGLMDQARNPIIMLFWRALTGYRFRAFDEVDVDSNVRGAPIFRWMPVVLEAALNHDMAMATDAYRNIFASDLMDVRAD